MGKFIAIEIGSKITKIVYGQEKKDDILIKDYKFIENTDKIYTPDGDLNINEIQPLLKNVLKDMKVRRADCYLTVGGQSGMVRLREMPMVKMKDMKDIVRFEAEQFLPYNIDGFYIDFKVNQIKTNIEDRDTNSESNDEKVAEVMIVAAPKESVDEQVNLVDKLKLSIKRVDYYTDAVYCYFKRYVLKEDKNTLVVDLGAKGLKLTMFNGQKYFANIFSEIGLEEIFQRYSEQNDISLEESRNILMPQETLDFQDKRENVETIHTKLDRLREKLQFTKMEAHHQNPIEYEIEPELERVYEQLAYEVNKMMEFFKTRQFGMSVDQVYLIGGGANLSKFNAFLKYYHNVDVYTVDNLHSDSNVSPYDYHLLVPVIGGLLKGGC